MDKTERKRIMKAIKLSHESYLFDLDNNTLIEKRFQRRFKNMYNKIRDLLRKEYNSENSLKSIPRIVQIIFGIQEDIRHTKIKKYLFECEIDLICSYVQARINHILNTNYNGKCGSFGETLLNCYLDLMITLTTRKTEKEIEAYPSFLINPLTGQNLELDVLFEGFKLAFEFQGEHHYNDCRVSGKDREKINQCTDNNIVLIPVNAFQLNARSLFDLTANSIKDSLNLGVIVDNMMRTSQSSEKIQCSKAEMSNYFKVLQRIKLAHMIFGNILSDLNSRSDRYIRTQNIVQPVSTTTNAPRAFNSNLDYGYIELYNIIPRLNKVFKTNKSE